MQPCEADRFITESCENLLIAQQAPPNGLISRPSPDPNLDVARLVHRLLHYFSEIQDALLQWPGLGQYNRHFGCLRPAGGGGGRKRCGRQRFRSRDQRLKAEGPPPAL